jgi:hypothetical protein
MEAEMKICLVDVEITDLEANSKEKETEIEQQEVPN